jgi:hypothetical protein
MQPMHMAHLIVLDDMHLADNDIKRLMALADKVENLERKVARLEEVSDAHCKQDEQFQVSALSSLHAEQLAMRTRTFIDSVSVEHA